MLTWDELQHSEDFIAECHKTLFHNGYKLEIYYEGYSWKVFLSGKGIIAQDTNYEDTLNEAINNLMER